MPKADNPIIYTKKCPFSGYLNGCPNGDAGIWNIKNFNGNESCKKYASCSCGGVIRMPNNQALFDEIPVMEIPSDPAPVAGTDKDNSIVEKPIMETDTITDDTHNEPQEPVKRVGSGWGAVIR